MASYTPQSELPFLDVASMRVARIWERGGGGGGFFKRVRKVQTTLTRIFIVFESIPHGLSVSGDGISRKARKFKPFFRPKTGGLQNKKKVSSPPPPPPPAPLASLLVARKSVLIAPDETEWLQITSGDSLVGRCSQQNILRETSGPTPYTKRNVFTGSPASAWRLLIDDFILKHIAKCTIT